MGYYSLANPDKGMQTPAFAGPVLPVRDRRSCGDSSRYGRGACTGGCELCLGVGCLDILSSLPSQQDGFWLGMASKVPPC